MLIETLASEQAVGGSNPGKGLVNNPESDVTCPRLRRIHRYQLAQRSTTQRRGKDRCAQQDRGGDIKLSDYCCFPYCDIELAEDECCGRGGEAKLVAVEALAGEQVSLSTSFSTRLSSKTKGSKIEGLSAFPFCLSSSFPRLPLRFLLRRLSLSLSLSALALPYQLGSRPPRSGAECSYPKELSSDKSRPITVKLQRTMGSRAGSHALAASASRSLA